MRIVRCGTDICQVGLFDVLMFVGEIGLDLRLNFTVWVCGDFSLRLIGLVIIFAGQKSRQGLYLVVTCYPRAAFRLRSMTGPGLMYCRPFRAQSCHHFCGAKMPPRPLSCGDVLSQGCISAPLNDRPWADVLSPTSVARPLRVPACCTYGRAGRRSVRRFQGSIVRCAACGIRGRRAVRFGIGGSGV